MSSGGLMPKIYPYFNSFNAGEISELLYNREDITKYKSACRVLENAFPLVEGGAQKMPGTYFAGPTKGNAHSRLVSFQFSTAQGAILELSAGVIRIWEPTAPGTWTLGLVLSAPNTPLELVTPYTDADLFNLDCGTQSADTLWIFHPNYPPACVERHGPTVWTYGTVPPGVQIGVNSPAYRGTSETITTGFSGLGVPILQLTQAFPLVMITDKPFANGDRVYINQCAGMVEINEGEFYVTPVLQSSDQATFGASINGGSSTVSGTILDVGSVTGTILVGMQVSGANVSPNTIITAYLSGTGGTGTYQVNIPQLVVSGTSMTGQGGFAYNLIPAEFGSIFQGSISGVTLIVTSVTAGYIYGDQGLYFPGVAAGTIITGQVSGTPGGVGVYTLNNSNSFSGQISTIPVVSTAYLPYAGGGFAVKVIPVFATAGDYPACGTFYQGRLCTGGSNNNPLQFNGSVIEDFPDFIADPTEDDYAIQFTLLSTQIDQIISMVGSPNNLLLGTASGVWSVAGSTGSSISPTNVNAQKQSTQGVSQLQPQLVGDAAIFVSRSTKQVMFLVFDFVSNQWANYDLTRLNRQIMLGNSESCSGVVQTAFQVEPYPIFWAVRADGQLIGLVFNRQDQVFAWFRINMQTVNGGDIESVAVISGQSEEDMVVIVVNRLVSGATVRYVEYFYPQQLYNQLSNAFFVHAGLTLDLGPAVAITGITNANPPTVTAPGQTFANGSFVQITDVLGMTQINQDKTEAYTVINSDTVAGTFQLQGMDTTGFGTYTGGGEALPVTNEVTGMSYLLGNTVTAVGDAMLILPPTVVTSDSITFDYYCAKITIGIPYTVTIQPTNPVLSSQASTTRGQKQKLSRVTISLYQSIGGQYGTSLDHMYDITYGPESEGH